MTIDESGGETKTRVDHQTGTAETTKIPTGMQFGLARAIYSSPPRRHHHLPPAGPAQGETTASQPAEPSRAEPISHHMPSPLRPCCLSPSPATSSSSSSCGVVVV